MALLLYTMTAVALLALANRAIRPLSRTASLLLFLLPFCFAGYALLTGGVYAPIDLPYATEPLSAMKAQYGIGQLHAGILSDIAAQMIPWRKTVQWSLANHQWPLHNPFILDGDILAAAAQPAAYSPFTLLACLLPVATSFTYTAAITLLVAALGAFLFARELGCGEIASLAGAAAWMSSTDIVFFLEWPLGFSWAFLPLVLLGVRRVVRTPSFASGGVLAVALTLMLLAGHPETALHVVFVAAIYATYEIAFHARLALRAIVAGVAAGIVALLVSAVYILPFVDAVGQTTQNAFRAQVYAYQSHGVTMPNVLARLATDVAASLHLARWNAPSIDNVSVDTAAVGSIALALAIYAMWRVRSRDSWFFTALAVFCALAGAQWTPVAVLLQKLPLFDVALNERLSFAAAFALSVLAALAIEDLLRKDVEDRRPRLSGQARRLSSTRGVVFTAIVVLAAVAIVIAVAARSTAPNVEGIGAHATAAEIAGLACAIAVLASPLQRRWLAASIIGLLLLQRGISEGDIYATFPVRAAYPPIPIFSALKNVREPFRVTGVGAALLPNQSALYELEDVRGYEAMTLNLYAETWRLWCAPQPVSFNRVDDLTKPFLSFLNVRYAIVPATYPTPTQWRIAAQQPGAALLENMNVIPRAFVPARVRFYDVAWEAVNEMTRETDFRQRAWIQAPRSGEIDNGPGTVVVARRPYGYAIDTTMRRDGWVVVSESAWKGWRAFVDGNPAALQLANAAFLSVHVPRGRHRLKFVFQPRSFVVGRAITLVSLALLIAVIIARAWSGRRTSSSR